MRYIKKFNESLESDILKKVKDLSYIIEDEGYGVDVKIDSPVPLGHYGDTHPDILVIKIEMGARPGELEKLTKCDFFSEYKDRVNQILEENKMYKFSWKPKLHYDVISGRPVKIATYKIGLEIT